MLPLDFNQSVTKVVSAIEAYQKETVLNSNDINTKVNDFVKSNGNAIPESDRKQIDVLLGRLSDQNTKDAACTELTSLISKVASTIQQPCVKESDVDQALRLAQAKLLFFTFRYDSTHLDKFVSMTSEQERLAIIKDEITSIKTGSTFEKMWIREWITHLASNIDRYKFTEQERVDLVRFLLERDPYAVVQQIKKFSINDQTSLKELAVSIAHRDGRLISNFIQVFNIKDEKDRIEIAKIAAEQDEFFSIAKYIPNYQISKEEDRFEIAIIEASQRSWNEESEGKWRHLEYYNIVNENYRIALALRSANFGSEHISKHIKDYEITKESDRAKIAQVAASNRSKEIFQLIDNYELSEEGRTAVAMTGARFYVDSWDNRQQGISPWMDRFKLKDEKNRFEVAKLAAIGSFTWRAEDIKHYQLSEQNRTVIATIVAEKPQCQITTNFHYYNITDEKSRVSIATTAARINGDWVFKDLDCFNITNRADRQAVLSIALAQIPINILSSTEMYYVKKFDETDQIMIAKFMASRNKDFQISNYKITKESDRIEIAKIYAKNFGMDFAVSGLRGFNIQDKKAILDIYLLAVLGAAPESREYILSRFVEQTKSQKEPSSPSFLALKKEAEKLASKDSAILEHFNAILLSYNWACDAAQFTEEVRKEQSQYVSQILQYEDPAMRYGLIAVLLQYGIPKKAEGQGHHLLFDMLLTPIMRNSGLTSEDHKQIWAILKHKDYYESSKKEKVLKGLMSMLLCDDMSAKEKGTLLKHIFAKKVDLGKEKSAQSEKKLEAEAIPPYTALQMLDAVISSRNVAVLKKGPEIDTKEASEKDAKSVAEGSVLIQPIDLSAAVNRIFIQTIRLETLEGFSEKYEKTIGSARNPMALLIYGTKLGSLSETDYEQAAKTLKEFATAVLEGNYKSWRYTTVQESHMEQIFKDRAKMKENWMAGESFSLSDFYKKLEEENLKVQADSKSAAQVKKGTEKASYATFDPVQFLKNKILDDKHIDPKQFPRLSDCLNDPKKCTETLKSLAEASKKDKLPKNEVYNAKNNQTKPLFFRQLEVALINLLVSSTPASKKISDIDKFVLPQVTAIYGASADITKDILLLKANLQPRMQSETKAMVEKKYIIEDTDHWEDMLLSGTEVSGSCQRISGDVSYNKCLLAYLADAKNRAIVIKDAKTGQIVARRIMRLLWNPESKQPVLFQERLYNNPGVPEDALKAMDLMFARRAKQLGVPLVRSINKEQANYPNGLESLNSPSPFEYVDAGGLGVTNGAFTIPAYTIFRVEI